MHDDDDDDDVHDDDVHDAATCQARVASTLQNLNDNQAKRSNFLEKIEKSFNLSVACAGPPAT